MGSMVQYSLMISDSMEKHGEHGTAFLVISDSIEKHGEHGTAFSHDFRSMESMGNS